METAKWATVNIMDSSTLRGYRSRVVQKLLPAAAAPGTVSQDSSEP